MTQETNDGRSKALLLLTSFWASGQKAHTTRIIMKRRIKRIIGRFGYFLADIGSRLVQWAIATGQEERITNDPGDE